MSEARLVNLVWLLVAFIAYNIWLATMLDDLIHRLLIFYFCLSILVGTALMYRYQEKNRKEKK